VFWVLERYVPAGEAMAGDLIEQFRGGRSAFWLCRQVAAVVVMQLPGIFFGGRIMKRKATWMLVLLCVFSFGFWAGRSPFFTAFATDISSLFTAVEPPPPIQPVLPRNLASNLARTWRDVFPTMEFLRMELDKARKEHLRENTPKSKLRVEDLERKLSAAKRYVGDRER
jgi:hypothetical protein